MARDIPHYVDPDTGAVALSDGSTGVLRAAYEGRLDLLDSGPAVRAFATREGVPAPWLTLVLHEIGAFDWDVVTWDGRNQARHRLVERRRRIKAALLRKGAAGGGA